jgi:hypothetical protein
LQQERGEKATFVRVRLRVKSYWWWRGERGRIVAAGGAGAELLNQLEGRGVGGGFVQDTKARKNVGDVSEGRRGECVDRRGRLRASEPVGEAFFARRGGEGREVGKRRGRIEADGCKTTLSICQEKKQ